MVGRPRRRAALVLAVGVFVSTLAARARAGEIWLHDNTRVCGLVRQVTEDQRLVVLLPTGRERKVVLEDVVSIRFLGRDPLLVQTGTQEFRSVNGPREAGLRGQILGSKGDVVTVRTAVAGTLDLDLSHFKGFVSLPLAGFTGRKAEELVEGNRGRRSRYEDLVLDRRGGAYPGVLKRLARTEVEFDVDSLLQLKRFPIHYVKGIRLADAGRDEKLEWAGDVQVFMWTRDGSVLQGRLAGIRLGKWRLKPAWDPKATIEVNLDEIALVQTLGGRVQYLSQLTPVAVKESTALAPPQPFRMDRSCQGDLLSIAGRRYPWGIGVHADAELTFALDGRYREFRSHVGIDTRVGERGSVVFSVLGDGRTLATTPVVRGSDGGPHEIRVAVTGVKRLTLKVTNAGDLDLGDIADWGSARVIRGASEDRGAEGRMNRGRRGTRRERVASETSGSRETN